MPDYQRAGRGPETELPKRFGLTPTNHYDNANALRKIWDIISYQVDLRLFEVTGLCQFPLTRVFCLYITYVPGKCSFFVWKLMAKTKIIFSQSPSGYRRCQKESQKYQCHYNGSPLPTGPPGWRYLSRKALVTGGLELGLTFVVSDSKGYSEVPHKSDLCTMTHYFLSDVQLR